MASSSLTIKQLRYFVRVVETGSITRAAEALHVAQPALGVQIRTLEDRLDAILLERHHNGVSATEAGQLVYERAGRILQGLEAMAGEVARLEETEPRRVPLGLTPTLMQWIGPRAVREESNRLPGVHLHLVEGRRDSLLEGLQAGEFKYVFAHDVGSDSELQAVPILRQPLVLVARPGVFSEPGPVTLAQALSTNLALRGNTSHVARVITRAATEAGLSHNVTYEIDSLRAVQEMIRNFGATSVMPLDYVMGPVSRGDFESREIVEPRIELTLEFVMQRNAPPMDADIPLLGFLDELLEDYLERIGAADRRVGRLAAIAERHLAAE